MRRYYLILCVLGAVLPYAALISWLGTGNGFEPARLYQDLVGNRLSLMAWLDVAITAVALIAFMRHECRRIQTNLLLLPLLATLCVGPSLGLPLFLYLREGVLAAQ